MYLIDKLGGINVSNLSEEWKNHDIQKVCHFDFRVQDSF